ncbi:MAG TPA: DNA replication/repair protein RecF [Hyphomonadaceae bacterium]|nr:DNA replication/repair protein RecF [Hyphomonadaceae bacterium]HPI49671.1 DNA replication/repair protein RecF [Hyphomonadaceae bacterium]
MTDLSPRRPHVRLTRLALQDFRNYASLQLRLDGRHVCLYGANGSGKTNLMEAVSMLSPGRGLRGSEFTELIRRDAEGQLARSWALSADVKDGDVDRKIGLSLELDDQGKSKRTARLDGVTAVQADLGELMRIIWLTPSMDRVFVGPAGDRRRFLDRQVMAHFPSHGTFGAAYEKAMRQRNALLERGRADPAWLDALELGMASAGAAMAIHRVDAVRVMQEAILARPEGAFPKALIDLDGQFETHAAHDMPLTDIEQAIATQLRENRSRDQAAGRTSQGVHRTDLRVIHAPKGQPADQCSTGEQKALLIGLILANAQALFERDFAPSPLLLLDEAAAHLDSDRRAALYDELAALGGQAWLTGTDRSLFDAFGDRAQRFEVSDGVVREG